MKWILPSLFFICFGIAACQQQAKSDPPPSKDSGGVEKSKTDSSKTSLISPDKGIGPIKEIKLESIDPKLVDAGKAIFGTKCVVCHDLDKKKIGPPLREVTAQRTPEFIMNMMLNTVEMEQKNAEVKKLISQYQAYMTDQGLTKDQVRSLLDYLRAAKEEKKTK